MKKLFAALLLALCVVGAPSVSSAQTNGATNVRPNYVGRWSGVTDWEDAVEGYDNVNAFFIFSADGTFTDDHNGRGDWAVSANGAIRFQFIRDDGSRGTTYTGRIVGNTLLGTMTSGEFSGVFAFRR